jgi:transcriptional regulator with XRE-family HTH domain
VPLSPRLVAPARLLAGLTQRSLAAEAGVNAITLARIETGSASPHASTLKKLRAALEARGVQFLQTPDAEYVGMARGLLDRPLAGTEDHKKVRGAKTPRHGTRDSGPSDGE